MMFSLLKQPDRLFPAPGNDHDSLPLGVESLLGCVELSSPGLALDEGRESSTARNKVWNSASDSRRSKYAATSRNQGSDDFSVGVVNLGGPHALALPAPFRSRNTASM